ncbi:MAG: hypothetical protein WEA10_07815 [Actinomycetota bacterium]
MAIKSKNKGRSRSAKQVTRGPKFQPKPLPVPFFRRRSVQIVGAFIAGVALVLVATWARDEIRQGRDDDAADEQAAALGTATEQFTNLVQPIVAEVGTASGTTIDPFPRLRQDLAAFADGSADPKEVVASAQATAEVAEGGIEKLSDVQPSKIFGGKGLSQAQVLDAVRAHGQMLNALEVYLHAARVAEEAMGPSGREQADLVRAAQGLVKAASEEFVSGYDDFVRVQASAGVFAPPQPAGVPSGIPSLPPGAEIPTGAPAP